MMILRVSAFAALGAHTAFGMQKNNWPAQQEQEEVKEGKSNAEDDELMKIIQQIQNEFNLPLSVPTESTKNTKAQTYAAAPQSESCTLSEPAAPSHTITGTDKKETAIFFDFDDTLVPTNYLTEIRDTSVAGGFAKLDQQMWKSMHTLATIAAQVVKEAKDLGQVCLVTAGTKNWIELVLNQTWAKPLKEALSDVEKKTTRGKDWFGPDANKPEWIKVDPTDPSTWIRTSNALSKQEQMENFLNERPLETSSQLTNLISVGDSSDEINAIKEIGAQRGVAAKSIKLEYGLPNNGIPAYKIFTVAEQLQQVLKDLSRLRNGALSSNHLEYETPTYE